MNNGKSLPVNLRIIDKDYVVACPEQERDTLLASAQYLNDKIREIREGGKLANSERIVVISALNIIHEFFQYKQNKETELQQLNAQIINLQEKIALALTNFNQ
jgi:cell division protein ZapA